MTNFRTKIRERLTAFSLTVLLAIFPAAAKADVDLPGIPYYTGSAQASTEANVEKSPSAHFLEYDDEFWAKLLKSEVHWSLAACEGTQLEAWSQIQFSMQRSATQNEDQQVFPSRWQAVQREMLRACRLDVFYECQMGALPGICLDALEGILCERIDGIRAAFPFDSTEDLSQVQQIALKTFEDSIQNLEQMNMRGLIGKVDHLDWEDVFPTARALLMLSLHETMELSLGLEK